MPSQRGVNSWHLLRWSDNSRVRFNRQPRSPEDMQYVTSVKLELRISSKSRMLRTRKKNTRNRKWWNWIKNRLMNMLYVRIENLSWKNTKYQHRPLYIKGFCGFVTGGCYIKKYSSAAKQKNKLKNLKNIHQLSFKKFYRQLYNIYSCQNKIKTFWAQTL